MNKTLVRAAVDADVPQIAAIEAQCFDPPWSADDYFGELGKAHARLAVAAAGSANDQIVAFISYWVVADEIQLLKLATALAWRRQGIALQLVDWMLAEAATTRARLVTVELRARNFAALRVYHYCGFSEKYVRSGYYSDGEDAVVMELELH